MSMSSVICRKSKYRTEQDASFALDKIRKTSGRSRVPVRYYLCDICHSWHLTSQPSLNDIIQENTELKKTIKALEKEISELKRSDVVQIRTALKKDELVNSLKQMNKKCVEQLKRLRKDQMDLIIRYNQIQSKLNMYEKKKGLKHMTYNLYLDDVRTPKDSFYGGPSLMPGNSIYLNDNWQVVRSYKEFVEKIYDMGMPENVSFDHDLADEHMKFYFTRIVPFNEDPTKANFNEKTGYDCALFLITYAEENNLPIPNFYVHSANPIGAKRIKELLSDYTRYRAKGVSKDFVDYKNRQRANAR